MKPKVKFMLDYMTNNLWANDEFTNQKFGYHIDNLKELGLSKETINLTELIKQLYYESINPIYQNLPSFWSAEMDLFFQFQLRKLFENISYEISNEYDIQNRAQYELAKIIDVRTENVKLKQLLVDPVLYFNTNNIAFESEQELIDRVKTEYEKWKQREQNILSLANIISSLESDALNNQSN